jgi:chromosome segregation ATPase
VTDTPTNEELVERVRENFHYAGPSSAENALATLSERLEAAGRERDAGNEKHLVLWRRWQAAEQRVAELERERDDLKKNLIEHECEYQKLHEAAEQEVEKWRKGYAPELEELEQLQHRVAELEEALREIESLESLVTYDVVWDGVRQWVPKFKLIARAALEAKEREHPVGTIRDGFLYWTDEHGVEHSGTFVEAKERE